MQNPGTAPEAATPAPGGEGAAQWTASGRTTLSRPEDLVRAGLAAPEEQAALARVAGRYATAITPAVADLIDPSDPQDPIARQFVPSVRELDRHASEQNDPIGDGAHSPVPGIVHRYPDRVLLKAVGVCPVYCRFCFRREMVGPGKATTLPPAALAQAFAYIRERPDIWEVILTGGDPLVLPPRRIARISAALAAIPHVKVRRWHTRMPVAAPERVTEALAAALAPDDDRPSGDRAAAQAVYVAVHANHPRELTPAARAACARLTRRGIVLVSQTVLLRGVNDSVETLEALMRAFVETRIKPYYLHHGDLAPGTAHFRVPVSEGQALVRALRGRLSGLAQPVYVLDIPGGAGKVPIGPAHAFPHPGGGWTVTAPGGAAHRYFDSCAASG